MFFTAITASDSSAQTITIGQQAKLEKIISTYQQLFDEGDAASLSILFSQSANYSDGGHTAVVGREMIKNNFNLLFRKPHFHHTFKIVDILISDSLAYVRTTRKDTLGIKSGQNENHENEEYIASNPDYYKLSDPEGTNPLQKTKEIMTTSEIFILRRHDGGWKIERLIRRDSANLN